MSPDVRGTADALGFAAPYAVFSSAWTFASMSSVPSPSEAAAHPFGPVSAHPVIRAL